MRALLLDQTRKTHASIGVLIENKMYEASLILIYAWIDRMAWLSVKNDRATGGDFQKWVEEYLLKGSSLPCTAKDLWGARCGLLHTGSQEADLTRLGNAKKILYITGDQIKEYSRDNDDEIFVSILTLHHDIIGAIFKFSKFLSSNPEKYKIAKKKLEKILEAKLS